MLDISTPPNTSSSNLSDSLPVDGQLSSVIFSKSAKAQTNLQQLLPAYTNNQVITFMSDDAWSSYDLLNHYAQLLGPVDLYFTSWTITDAPVRTIIKLKRLGLIRSVHCVLDHRIKTMSAKPYQLLSAVIDTLALSKCHAKVICLKGQIDGISIVGSANLSRNRRIEAGTIFTTPAAVDFHINWIKETIKCKSQKKS